MSVLLSIIVATFLVSLISFIGVFTLSLKEKLLNKILLVLVALSAGSLMGGAFLHLIPEAIEKFMLAGVFINVLIGFVLFLVVEKVFHWRHCHKGKCDVHTFAHMNILGDIIHNLIDGLIIAASFVTNTSLGITTTIAVALHEIPQEIGDFGVLVYGGYKKSKALLLNFLTGLTGVIGGIIGYFLASYTNYTSELLLPFAAGGFIYIAASDLIPEIRKEVTLKKSLIYFGVFILGIVLMYLIKFLG
tara:strand:+ start:716 stop:1453 length:738 start_codon:yes stop_codon:yes gene_type:complete